MFTESKQCRNCKSNLRTVVDLGEIYPSNFVSNGGTQTEKVPLVLAKCENCGLVQLKYTVNLDLMYRKYWYKSGVNDEMVRHLQDIVYSMETLFEYKFGDVIVDIGCNDGTMLGLFNIPGVIKVGFDPAYNLADEAKQNCDYFINNYFKAEYFPLPYKAKVITAIAMFYDLENPNEFIEDIKEILDDDGVFIVQFADLASMLDTLDFPTICHEHIEYYDLKTIKTMLEKHGFSLFRAHRVDVNGGSLRLFFDLGKREVEHSVKEELKYEAEFFSSEDLGYFVDAVLSSKEILRNFIISEKERGKSISILGASTKGNTILQVFELDNTLIDYAADANEAKWGLKTIGTGIEIQSDEFVFSKKPDYMLVLPWFFIDNFIMKYQKYINSGGTFLIPLPYPRYYNKKGWHDL